MEGLGPGADAGSQSRHRERELFELVQEPGIVQALLQHADGAAGPPEQLELVGV